MLQSLWNRDQSVELYWWQWQLTWETNEAYNGIWITRTVEMTVLSFNKKNIYPLLTFAFEKKTFAGSERIGLIDLNSRNQQSL